MIGKLVSLLKRTDGRDNVPLDGGYTARRLINGRWVAQRNCDGKAVDLKAQYRVLHWAPSSEYYSDCWARSLRSLKRKVKHRLALQGI